MKTEQINVTAKDGEIIEAIYKSDDTQPIKGIVIIIHGFGEHAFSYDELAQRLAESGYANIIYSQRGHGELKNAKNRDKMLGIIPDYQTFLDDITSVEAAVRKLNPDIPVAIYGHSMGGNIVVNYLLQKEQTEYACAVLESPWLGLYKQPNFLIRGLAKILGGLSPNIAIVNKLSPDDITSDESKAAVFRKDNLYHNRISMRLFDGINKGCANALGGASKIALPTYLAYGKDDRIVSNKAIAEFSKAAGENVILKEYESRHAVHNDTIRYDYFNDVISYLNMEINNG